MARILITGSADGLGQMAAQRLVDAGHHVVLHARNRQRAQQAVEAVPKARSVLVGDLASIAEIHAIAEQAHAAGPFDAVIHNAGVGYREPRRETVDGLEHVFAVYTLSRLRNREKFPTFRHNSSISAETTPRPVSAR
jgi:NAD(P)-dependent dehydrogenase (short-subunit alcohol dehydrogenase family)